MNICRVTSESQIDKIIAENNDKVIIILFSFDSPNIRIFMKRQLAVHYKDFYFVFACVDRPGMTKVGFIADKGTYVQELKDKTLPFLFLCYNGKYIGTIDNASPEGIIQTLDKLKSMKESADKKQEEEEKDNEKNKILYEKQVEEMDDARKLYEMEEGDRLKKMLDN